MSVGTLVVKLSFVGAASFVLPLQGHIDWDWWFSYGNLTANYARVTCVTEGVGRRPEYEARVLAYFRANDMERRDLAQQYELFIAFNQLTDALHAAMYDEYLAGRSHYLLASDYQLLARLQDLAEDQHFRSALAKDNNTRGEVALTRELKEVKDYIPKNIERIAHPPKIALVCASLVGIAYWLYMKYGDKITQLAANAEEKVESEVIEAGHTLAHEITNLAHGIEGSDEKNS